MNLLKLFSWLHHKFSKEKEVANIIPLNEESKVFLFLDLLREYIDKYTLENQICEGTQKRYEVYWRNISLYFASKQLQTLRLEDVRVKHAEDFRSWLRLELRTVCVRHTSRHVELWKRVTKYAVVMEYAVNDSLSPLKALRDRPKKIISLTTREIKKIMVYNFGSDIFRIVADLFLFQCFTGLSYSDIYKYNIVEREGKLWIEGDRTKTDEEYVIYFFPEAREILEKYQWKLPRLSNQKYNEYLKEIALILGIRKKLTTHVGRKTHASILSERGVGTKPIALQLGNTERVCEESYIHKTHAIINNEIMRLGLDDGLLKAS